MLLTWTWEIKSRTSVGACELFSPWFLSEFFLTELTVLSPREHGQCIIRENWLIFSYHACTCAYLENGLFLLMIPFLSINQTILPTLLNVPLNQIGDNGIESC